MSPRLEELRKRLMPSEATGSSDAIFTRSLQSAPAEPSKQAINPADAAEWNSDAQGPPPAEPIAHQKATVSRCDRSRTQRGIAILGDLGS